MIQVYSIQYSDDVLTEFPKSKSLYTYESINFTY